jgi:bifunctional DNA-binding transcriptional regulator/antitoxin component of YhaV-PrlF toxin-antitoxin module
MGESVARAFESKAVKSLKRSASLRTTVPEAVAALLGLEPGNSLLWTVEPGSGVVTVSRKEPSESGKRESRRR